MHTAESFDLFRQVLTKLRIPRLQMAVGDMVRAMDTRGVPGAP
jgi:hypothetical protein